MSQTDLTRADFRFFHRFRVRWGEVDAQGVVFNPNYLMFADVAGTEYMRAVGVTAADMHDLFVVNANVDFMDSALFDEELDMGVRVERIGRSSLHMTFGLFRHDAVLTRVSLAYVRVDPAVRKSIPLDGTLIDRVRTFEGERLLVS